VIDSFIASARPAYEDRQVELHHLYRDCPVLVGREVVSGHQVTRVEWYDRPSCWELCGRCEERAAQETQRVVVILGDPHCLRIYCLSPQEAAGTLDGLYGEHRFDAGADEWDRMGAEDVSCLDYEVREVSVLDLSRIGPLEP
jgi:hypothetical protein